MPDTRGEQQLGFTRRVAIETPEHVVLELELAGFGSRLAAAVLDTALQVALLVLLLSLVALGGGSAAPTVFGESGAGWVGAAITAVWFAVLWGYFTLFEGLWGGRTPGKHRMGIRVVMDTGHPVGFRAAAVRNLLRIADAQPFNTYLVGLPFLFFERHHRRLGDLVAGTIVVYDRPTESTLASRARTQDDSSAVDLGPPLLADAEFRLLDRLVARLVDLDAGTRHRLVPQLAERIAQSVEWDGRRPEAFLVGVFQQELARRRARTAARRTGDRAKALGTAERFVAMRQADWEAFRVEATNLEARGLGSLSGDAITAFARRYRAVTADLARARTYGVDPRTIAHLERIAHVGHNAVYGLRGVRRLPIRHLLLDDFPAAVYRHRRVVMLAAAIFVLPGLAGYAVIRERPDIAQEILPAVMIERAEAGQHALESGRGYAEAPSPYLPTIASRIIANNVQVAFAAFALGVTAGIGTVAVLAFNGLFFGAVVALFANYGIVGWLLTFVAGHGVLELPAIFIAGAAGLLIGRGMLIPGDLTRKAAIVAHGREAIRLVGAAASLLLLAGVIEGFLSASGAPSPLKLAVSAAGGVLLVLYYQAGRAAQRPRGERRQRQRATDIHTFQRDVGLGRLARLDSRSAR
jgi:uncharacterized membrane protein SpoIIM required for sporulation/uncharacterized RDD family membrane protein YckC